MRVERAAAHPGDTNEGVRAAPGPSSPIFIVGCPRSGTSILRDLLRSHPRLTFPGESHFIPAFYRGYGDPRNDRDAIRLARRILQVHWVEWWRLAIRPEEFAADRTFRGLVSRLFEEYARTQGKPRWGDKTPHYVTAIPTLREIFPDCQVIHIYRDGRDTALSWLRAGFQARNVYTAASLWRRYISEGRRGGRALPTDAYHEVRYESLISQTEDTMRAVCAFLGEKFDSAVLRPAFLERRKKDRIFGPRNPRVPVSKTDVVAGNMNKWKHAMPRRDRAIFESVAGDLLQELGYETEGLARTVSGYERVKWGVHQRFWWVAARLNSRESHRLLLTDLHVRWAHLRSRFRSSLGYGR